MLFEIPQSELDKDFVWNVSIKKTTLGAGFGGQSVSSRVVRWMKRGDRILLLEHGLQHHGAMPTIRSRRPSPTPTIRRSSARCRCWRTRANGDAGRRRDVALHGRGVAGVLGARRHRRPRRWRADRSFLERAVSFPENINVEATLTFTGGAADAGGGGGGGGGGGAARGMRGPSGTVRRAPQHDEAAGDADDAAQLRRARRLRHRQPRVDFGTDEHRSVRKRIINRFRLEKKDPNAAMSDPVKPIVFYIDPATPAKWVPFVKRGVESWQPAFEAAGFRNAIDARDAPKDPEWSAEDARYSVIHWVPTHDRERSRTSTIRAAARFCRPTIDVYPNVADVRPDVVLRAGGRRRQARAAAAAARRAAAASCCASSSRIRSATRSASRTT